MPAPSLVSAPSHLLGPEAKRVALGFQLPVRASWLSCLAAVWSYLSSVPSLSLSFPFYKVDIIITAPTSCVSVELGVMMHTRTSARGHLQVILRYRLQAELDFSFPSYSSLGHGGCTPPRGQPPVRHP